MGSAVMRDDYYDYDTFERSLCNETEEEYEERMNEEAYYADLMYDDMKAGVFYE